jgi:hypothetical protein
MISVDADVQELLDQVVERKIDPGTAARAILERRTGK